MKCELNIHSKHFRERMSTKNLTLFDIFKYLYPEKAKTYITPTDKNNAVRKIRSWQDGYTMPQTLNEFFKLCELFDCDAEYLIGNQGYARKDNLDAIEKTGLDYYTVDIISNFPKEYKQIIDLLAYSGNLEELLKDFLSYAHSNLQHGIVIDDSISAESEHKKREIDGNELRMIRKYDISNKLSNILEFLRKCYWNDDLKSGVDVLKQQLKSNDNSQFDELYNELKI